MLSPAGFCTSPMPLSIERELTLVVVQLRVAEPPAVMVAGVAENVSVGGGIGGGGGGGGGFTVTVICWETLWLFAPETVAV